MKKFMIAVLLMIATVTTSTAMADNFFEVGADVQSYGSFGDITELDTSLALNARLGSFAGFYGFGSYEQPDVRLFANNQGKVRTWGLGAGYRLDFASNWYALGEVGYYMPSESSDLSAYDYSNEFGYAVGLGYDINDNWTLNTKYRYLKLDQDYKYVGPVQETRVDMSAFSVGLSYRF